MTQEDIVASLRHIRNKVATEAADLIELQREEIDNLNRRLDVRDRSRELTERARENLTGDPHPISPVYMDALTLLSVVDNLIIELAEAEQRIQELEQLS